MTASLEELEEQVKDLPAEEQTRLVEVLLESLHAPISEIETDWAREMEERIAAFDRGEAPAHAAEDVFAEARRLSR